MERQRERTMNQGVFLSILLLYLSAGRAIYTFYLQLNGIRNQDILETIISCRLPRKLNLSNYCTLSLPINKLQCQLDRRGLKVQYTEINKVNAQRQEEQEQLVSHLKTSSESSLSSYLSENRVSKFRIIADRKETVNLKCYSQSLTPYL